MVFRQELTFVYRSAEIESEAQTFETTRGRELIKEPVVSWATLVDDESSRVLTKPLVAPVDPGGDQTFEQGSAMLDDADLVETTPAADGTMRVSARFPRDDPDATAVIGIEYPNATIPDWDSVIDDMDVDGSWNAERGY